MIARRTLITYLIGLSSARTALANGDEYYRFNALNPKALTSQVIFAGMVKDTAGAHIPDAKITIGLNVNAFYGEKFVTFNAYTNLAGRYRALDVASVVSALEEVTIDVDPTKVQLSISKDGYTMARKLNRSRSGQKAGVFEVDFTLEKVKQAE